MKQALATRGWKTSFTGGSSSSTVEDSKCDLEMHSIAVLAKSEPANETPCSPISQISDTLLPVTVKATEIMAFRENYTQPAEHPGCLHSHGGFSSG
jgi:phosphoenolpyruvate carboxylase